MRTALTYTSLVHEEAFFKDSKFAEVVSLIKPRISYGLNGNVIDLGPEGGDKGGNIVAVGTPEEVAACGASYTGQFLKEKLA